MSDLYPSIGNDEHRGDNYFEATVKHNLEVALTPAGYQCTLRKGDRLILRATDDHWFVVLGIHGNRPWPTYVNAIQDMPIHIRNLEDIVPREGSHESH